MLDKVVQQNIINLGLNNGGRAPGPKARKEFLEKPQSQVTMRSGQALNRGGTMILAPVSNQPKNDFSSIPNPKENMQALLNGPYLDLS